MKFLSLSLCVVLGLLSACGASENTNDTEGVRLSFGRLTDLSNTTYSGITEPKLIVMNTQAQLDTTWTSYTTGMTTKPTKPTINFTTQTLVAFFPGALPSPCHKLVIESVKDAGAETKIFYRIDPPKADTQCNQVIVYPHEWLVLNKTNDTIKAVKRN